MHEVVIFINDITDGYVERVETFTGALEYAKTVVRDGFTTEEEDGTVVVFGPRRIAQVKIVPAIVEDMSEEEAIAYYESKVI